ncbi:MAG: hypothetical protein QNK37_25920 [Acidobacteriota bacterium]|nr:hypothetical protein [Acidobacteriota bacterium]
MKQTISHPTQTDHSALAVQLLEQNPVLTDKIVKAVPLAAEEAPAMLTEVLRFLHLIAWSDQKLTPPLTLDNAWHEFILFTRAYAAYCQEQFGRFIHHQPGGTEDENGRQLRAALKLYQLCFGTPDTRYWGDHGYWSRAADCGSCEG